MTQPRIYDFLIVGGGIAGLAIGEIFSRSGLRVAIVEKNLKVCSETSGEHHGWFHFGSLYSIFPNNQFMRTLVGGIDDLLMYYSCFPNMNLNVEENGKLAFRTVDKPWFRDEDIQYIVSARNDPDFDLRTFDGTRNYIRKLFFLLSWEYNIKQFISRHQRFHKFDWRTGPASQNIPRAGWSDYSREVINKVGNIDIRLDTDTHFRIVGFDKPMNATSIVTDLLGAFVESGGSLICGESFREYNSRGRYYYVVTDANCYYSRNIIFASGKELKNILGNNVRINIVASPLLVMYPAVCNTNFVRLTPFVSKTVNHILHYTNGIGYSVVGGGYFADPSSDISLRRAQEDLINIATNAFPKLPSACINEIYFSYKTEVSAKYGERNYLYNIIDVDKNVYAVVPGKFSLGFSLAVNAYKRIIGEEPAKSFRFGFDVATDVSQYVGKMRHQRIVDDNLT